MIQGWTVIANHDGADRPLDLIVNGLVFTDSQQEGRVDFDRSINTRIKIAGADYAWLWAIRNSPERCEEITITLSKGLFSFFGQIRINKVRWDHVKGTATFSIKNKSDYEAIDENSDEKVNILDSNTKHVAKIIIGTIVEFDSGTIFRSTLLNYFGNPELDANPPPNANGWTLKNNLVEYNVTTDPPNPVLDGDVRSTYAREEVNSATQPPGSGWIEETPGLWVRGVSMVQTLRTFTNHTFTLEQDVLGNDGRVYDNGVKFADVLTNMFSFFGFQVNSRMFNIGDTTPDANHDATVYAFTDEYLADLLIYQKSDVKRPSAGENATNGRVRYDKVLNILMGLKVKYKIEDDTTNPITIRLEHESYFQQSIGLDLTLSPYVDQLRGLGEQDSEDVSIPRRQSFSWMEETNPEFDGIDIQYPVACSTPDVEEIQVDIVNNNIVALGQEENNEFSDTGFSLVSVGDFEGDFLILSLVNPLTNAVVPNNVMSWPSLQDILYRHNALYFTGIVNGQNVTFESSQNTLKQPIIVTGFSLDDYANFDPSQSVNTPDGVASVIESSYDEQKGTLQLQLTLD